jgi:hypothetical protein
MKTATKVEQEAMFAQIREGFVADALMANWDVAGLSMDNIFVVGKNAYRIDNGGALAYRAQGAKKPLGTSVDELVSLRDPKINQNTAKIFGKITDEEIDDQIYAIIQRRKAVEDAITDTQLRNTIKARIDSLEALAESRSGSRVAGDWRTRVKQSKPESGISKDSAKRVKESRINGTTFKTDKDLIEDNNVLVWEEVGQGGKEVTRVQFKVTYEGSKQLEKTIKGLGVDVSSAVSGSDQYWMDVLKFSKTVSVHVTDGAYNKAVVKTAEDLLKNLKLQVKTLSGEDKSIATHYISELKRIKAAKSKKKKSPIVSKYVRKPQKGTGSGIKHRTEDAEFRVTEIKNGRARDLKAQQSVGSTKKQVILELEDGTEVRFIPRDETTNSGPALAVRGNVEITAQGEVTTERLNKIMSQIKGLGVDTSVATAEWEELLYLHRTVYLRNQADDIAYKKIWNSTKLSEKEKITKIQSWVKEQSWGKKVNFKSKVYKDGIDGQTMTSGNGNRYWNRWDLTPDDIEKSMGSQYVLSHNSSGTTADVLNALLQSGGEATATTGRLRKGIRVGGEGMSSSSDMNTGGASYFFTRIIRRNKSSGGAFRFKIRNLARQDMVSYASDEFGRISGYARRKFDIPGFRSNAGKGGNESIFKNGLSILDDLEYIKAVNVKERDEIIKVFKDNKITHLNDGRRVEDVVIRRSEVAKL